jgi:hypothetical protein
MAPNPTRKCNTPAAGDPSSPSSIHPTRFKKERAASPAMAAAPGPVVTPIVEPALKKKAGNPAVAAAPCPVVSPDSVDTAPVVKPATGMVSDSVAATAHLPNDVEGKTTFISAQTKLADGTSVSSQPKVTEKAEEELEENSLEDSNGSDHQQSSEEDSEDPDSENSEEESEEGRKDKGVKKSEEES